MIKQMQSLTDQMSLKIRSQQLGPHPPVESSRHASGLWCGVYSVDNPDTLDSFVELDRTVIKGTMMAHLHRTQKSKVIISMVRAIIEDLPLKCKVVKMWKERSSILFVGDDMHNVSVGPKDKVMVVVIVGETILRTNVVNLTRLLACPIR
jgi:hypothetical protein